MPDEITSVFEGVEELRQEVAERGGRQSALAKFLEKQVDLNRELIRQVAELQDELQTLKDEYEKYRAQVGHWRDVPGQETVY